MAHRERRETETNMEGRENKKKRKAMCNWKKKTVGLKKMIFRDFQNVYILPERKAKNVYILPERKANLIAPSPLVLAIRPSGLYIVAATK